ncbi:TonB family protein [Allocoleopsis franciscana]|uniref:TonB family protein n=1 Tax=Allocoleopsis franciscana PCC 7113 TaxID=1173027 RepID=K9WBB0_9CYAN|nr:TonB family protein [Allocoleopsis franciscana]AFZ17523.1 TonB family protein [Allocoleopsis franciscana PCC 7113]
MSISNFCIEQREREQQALKKFLVYSLAGSAVFHVAAAFGVSWLWQSQPELADDPIEVILVENPDTEEKPLTDTPKPEPKLVKPPTPQQPLKAEAPKPPIPEPTIPTVSLKPQAQPAPIVPAAPEKSVVEPIPPIPPVPQRAQTQPAPPAPVAPPQAPREPEPIASPPPSPIATQEPVTPPANSPTQPLQDDSATKQPQERLSEPINPESDLNPIPPGSVADNRLAPPPLRNAPEPLSTDSNPDRQIRTRLGESSSAPTAPPKEDDSNPGSVSPGAVAANPSAPPRPTGSSQALQSSSPDSRKFRQSFGSESSPSTTSPGGGDSIGNPISPGAVAANSSAPPRPSSGNNRQGTENPGGNSEGSPTGSGRDGLQCIRKCTPESPSSLNGEEGRVGVQITVDGSGNVVNATIAENGKSTQMDQAAIAAANQMKFKAPGRRVIAQLNINFAREEGTEFERQARERQAQNERERQQREQERQAQQQQERQERERQAQLEREQKGQQERENQQQLERERQEQQERDRQERERQEQQERDRQQQQENVPLTPPSQ